MFTSRPVRSWAIFTLLCLSLICGCTTTKSSVHGPEELRYPEQRKILDIVLKSGDIIAFNEKGGTFIESKRDGKLYRAVNGVKRDGDSVEIGVNNIIEVRVEQKETNPMGTAAFMIVAVPAAIIIIAYITYAMDPKPIP